MDVKNKQAQEQMVESQNQQSDMLKQMINKTRTQTTEANAWHAILTNGPTAAANYSIEEDYWNTSSKINKPYFAFFPQVSVYFVVIELSLPERLLKSNIFTVV